MAFGLLVIDRIHFLSSLAITTLYILIGNDKELVFINCYRSSCVVELPKVFHLVKLLILACHDKWYLSVYQMIAPLQHSKIHALSLALYLLFRNIPLIVARRQFLGTVTR